MTNSNKSNIQSRNLEVKDMFGKKKLYRIVYERLCEYTMIVEARNEYQALRKFYRKTKYGIEPSIISIEECKVR